jgi:hypothetical protein
MNTRATQYRLGSWVIQMTSSLQGTWTLYFGNRKIGIGKIMGWLRVDPENDVVWLSSQKAQGEAESFLRTMTDVRAHLAWVRQWTFTRWALKGYVLSDDWMLLGCRSGDAPSKCNPESDAFLARLKRRVGCIVPEPEPPQQTHPPHYNLGRVASFFLET